MDDVIRQNKRLQDELAAQQRTIEELRADLSSLEKASQQSQQDLQNLRDRVDGGSGASSAPSGPTPGEELIRLSGEMGAAYFHSDDDGNYGNGQFRVDDARVFIDAMAYKDIFLHSEFDLAMREATDENLHIGELYIDLENLSGNWGRDDWLSVKAGRFFIPFGEEYQVRYVMDDPLISHSASDLWGMDQGIEFYGKIGAASYATAVQDGGLDSIHDVHAGKSVSGRLGYDLAPWLNVSASAMTTSWLNTAGDSLSALWFSSGFFRALNPTSSGFGADLYEGDAAVKWKGGQLKGMGGWIEFSDNAPKVDDSRRITYYAVEARQDLAGALYGAVRWSGIRAPGGYWVVGQGTAGEYLFGDEFTTSLTRLSMGLGYRLAPPVVIKVEYSPEWRSVLGSGGSEENDLISTELGVRF